MSPELSSQLRSVFLQEFEPLSRLAFNLTSNFPASRDIVLEVFVKLWNNGESEFNDLMGERLRKETVQSCYSFLTRPEVRTDAISEIDMFASYFHPENNQAGSPGELVKALAEGISKLPPLCRVIFILARHEGMNFEKISYVLDLPVENVESEMATAIEQLRKHC